MIDIFKKLNLFLYATLILINLSFSQNYHTTSELLGQDQVNTITTAVPFLMIAPDARAGSMGDVGVASTPDANSMHWNPAKYSFIEKDVGISISYVPWLRALVNDINMGYLSAYKKVGDKQALAASLRYFSLGDIIFTDIIGQEITQFKPNEFAVDFAYSRKLGENISGAVSLRYIYSNLTGGIHVNGAESHPGQSVATDVSVYYRKPLEINKKNAVIAGGINISNLGAKISYTSTTDRDFIPMNLKLGPSFFIQLDKYNSLEFMFDLNKLLVPTPPIYELDSAGNPVKNSEGKLVIYKGKDPKVGVVSGMLQSFYDAPNGFKEEIREFTYALGVEYWYDKQFAIRAGYFHEHPTKGNREYVTLGAGLKYNIFGLDFAYLIPFEQRNPLENTLRFTLLFDLDAFREQNKKTD
ncbi:MAG TPA: type IX secretion system outer membrane channel protein PorV [Bacteroidales bacterium]|nr:type IX secretion system outer membrane channel protein PorV [Bacteroidales bacterium]